MQRPYQPSCLRGPAGLFLAGLLLISWAGCARTARVDSATKATPIPLAPLLRLSNAAAMTLSYNNACGEPTAVSLGEPLAAALKQKLGQVFDYVIVDPAVPSDGVLDVALNLKQIELSLPRRTTKAYPATVTFGLEAVYTAEDGSKLWSKKIKSTELGTVDAQESSCDVTGLEAVVKAAADIVAQGLAMHVSESGRIRGYAEAAQSKRPGMARAAAAAVSPAPAGAAEAPVRRPEVPAHKAPETPVSDAAVSSVPQPAGEASPALTFRAILRDENRDHILQPDEPLTIELEVKNDGLAEAKGVEVIVGGTGALTAQLPPAIAIGDVQPGEIKRTTLTKPVVGVTEPLRGELWFSLRAGSAAIQMPPLKKFSVFVKPASSDDNRAAFDVDQPPKAALLKQPKAVVIAIGVGHFRDTQVPPVKFAARDAEVMAAYLQSIGGLSADRVRVLIDGHALKQDLAETFEEWLPKQLDPNTVVYVYVSGRALVDGVTGAVSLVPYDGTTTSVGRVYSVRRLQDTLARLPIQRAILMFDVSLEHVPGADPATGAAPVWTTGASDANTKTMWLIGNGGVQEAHAFERGRHGLFTYHLLKGLQGPADLDRDGTIVASELCAYARGEVGRMAGDQFGSVQEPVCLPAAGIGAMVRIHPIAKGNNPKPTAPVKKESTAQGEALNAPSTGVGPGQ